MVDIYTELHKHSGKRNVNRIGNNLELAFPREDISLKTQVMQIALAIREEVLDLEKNGIKIIQIDEAAKIVRNE